MKRQRVFLYGLLAVVAAAAAVLSFAALRDLALRCGFDDRLAWLLPVVVDAGAAAGSLVWMTTRAGAARRFGRRLALALLGSSVVGNGVAHLLDAYRLVPSWWLVVAVSALAPAVLAAVLHLAVLAVQSHTQRPEQDGDGSAAHRRTSDTPRAERGMALVPNNFVDTRKVADQGPAPAVSPVQVARTEAAPVREGWAPAPTPGDLADVRKVAAPQVARDPNRLESGAGPTSVEPMGQTEDAQDSRTPDDRAGELIAAGVGRRRLARELGVSEYEARRLKAERNGGAS